MLPVSNKERGMRSKQILVKVYVKPEEKAWIAANARAGRLSMSAYARTMALGGNPVHTLDLDEMNKLLKISADLGRLGGLLKMLLTNDERLDEMGREMGRATIDGTLFDIRATQAQLLDVVNAFARKAKARM
jgi:hypothetical protein